MPSVYSGARAAARGKYRRPAAAVADTTPSHLAVLAPVCRAEGRFPHVRRTQHDATAPRAEAPDRRRIGRPPRRRHRPSHQPRHRRDLLPGARRRPRRRRQGRPRRAAGVRVRPLVPDEPQRPGEAPAQARRRPLGAPRGVRARRLAGERQDLPGGDPRRRRAGQRHPGLRLRVVRTSSPARSSRSTATSTPTCSASRSASWRPSSPGTTPTCLACWKLGPALATGCTVILKPSELTPLTAMKLGELAREVGFPPGVLNVLPGYGAPTGEALARHPGVDKIAFTGSVRTARRLLHASADTNLKKLTLELGGQEPAGHLPRRGPGSRRRGLLLGHLRQQGRGLQRGQPGPGPREGPRRLRREAGRPGPADGGRRSAGRPHRDGRAGQPAPAGDHPPATSSRERARARPWPAAASATARAPRRRATSSSPPSSRTCSRTCASPRRKSSARCSR